LGVKVDVVSERTIKNEIKPYVYRDLIAVWIENMIYI
jgi:hypothetical protein